MTWTLAEVLDSKGKERSGDVVLVVIVVGVLFEREMKLAVRMRAQ